MNSQNESQLQQRQFLEAKADEWGFLGDMRTTFLKRFDTSNADKNNQVLAKEIEWNTDSIAQLACTEQKDDQPNSKPKKKEKKPEPIEHRAQKLQGELRNICDRLKDLEIEGFPQFEQQGRGRALKGESPWEKIYDWLWKDEYPNWQGKRQSDWHDTCLKMLNNQRSLTSNYLLADREDAQFERHQIFVPLALVQSTKADERSAEVSPAAGTRLYEPLGQRFEHDNFFTQILEGGKGKTKGERIALIGEPGAGKTTLLQDIAFRLMEETDSPRQQETKDVVIWISLAELQGRSLEEYLLQKWLKEALKVPRVTSDQEDALVELFNSGRVWLLLDGVDEMTTSDPQYAIAKSYLKGWVASARVVLTCRLNVWQANVNLLLADFEIYTLLNFDYPQQVREFIDKWFRNSDPAKGERLKVELDKAEQMRLRDLIQNPLRLMLLCKIWQSLEGELPQTKAGFYQNIVQQFNDWNKYPFQISPQKQRELKSALQQLALQDIHEGDSRFRLPESFVSQTLGDRNDEDSLFHLALKLGWLNDVGIQHESATRERVYAFFHTTLEEYFAALAIDDWRFFLKHIPDNPYHPDASYRIFEPKWEEVILLWLGREDVSSKDSKDKEEFIQALVEFDSGCGIFSDYSRRAHFLAAAGIAEFKDCSRADEIIEWVVQLILSRRFVIQEELWEAFAVFPKTERTRAINGLTRIIDQSQSEYIRLQAAGNLGRVDQGNSTAIYTLVTIITNSQNSFNFTEAAEILGQITKGNSTAIHTAIDALVRALVELIQNSPDTSLNIVWGMARILGEIAKDNPEVVNTLEVLIRESQSEYIDYHAANILGTIAKGNSTAINTLVRLIRDSQSTDIPRNAANTLWRIAKGDSIAIHALVKLIQDSQSEDTLYLAAEILGEIAKGDSSAIDTLESLIQNCQPESISLQLEAVLSLEKIDPGNSIASYALVELLQNIQSEDPRTQELFNLWYIDSDNPEVINALTELLNNSQDEYIRRQVASSLGKSGLDNPKVIAALAESLQNSQDESFIWLIGRIFRETGERYPTIIHALESLAHNSQPENILLKVAESLVAIGAGYSTATNILELLAHNYQSENIRIDAANNLRQINPDNFVAINTLESLAQNCPSSDIQRDGVVRSLTSILERDRIGEVVANFKACSSNGPSEDDFRQYQYWYEIIWRFARTLPYPEFYQAWHRSPHTPHPEVPEISGVGFTPDSQSLNLAHLPKILRAYLDSDSDLRGKVQLVCINGSSFIDRDNPATKIYNEMRLEGCPQYDDDRLTTMVQLQDYWDRLRRDRDRTYVLVFYETRMPLQGFSDTFLDALSKFDGAICVISNQLNLPLQSFSPNQLNLVADVVDWVREIVLENL